MSRPMKRRRVCQLPQSTRFGPLGKSIDDDSSVQMTIDEYESIRLIDLEGFTQEECAEQMSVARTTVQGIYVEARRKLAKALVEGRMLLIEGGQYLLCDGTIGCRGCGRRGYGHGRGNRRRFSDDSNFS